MIERTESGLCPKVSWMTALGGYLRGWALSIAPIAACAVALTGLAKADYVSTVTGTDSSNLLAYWHLDSVNQASAVNGYSSTWGSGVTVAPTAPDAGDTASASFDGSSTATIDTGLSNAFTDGGTMLSWVNLAELPSTLNRIDYVMGVSQFGNDLDVQFQNNNQLYFYTQSGASISFAPTPSTLVGQWHMIAATYDSSGNYDLYWDGQLEASGTGAHQTHSNEFAIGYSPVFGGRNFDGNIDEVSVWNTDLTGSQIQTIYNSASLQPVPEPAMFLPLTGGILALVGWARRRRARG